MNPEHSQPGPDIGRNSQGRKDGIQSPDREDRTNND